MTPKFRVGCRDEMDISNAISLCLFQVLHRQEVNRYSNQWPGYRKVECLYYGNLCSEVHCARDCYIRDLDMAQIGDNQSVFDVSIEIHDTTDMRQDKDAIICYSNLIKSTVTPIGKHSRMKQMVITSNCEWHTHMKVKSSREIE